MGENTMSKAFVIPDVHLKPWMFDKADELLSENEYDLIICLGDIADDWGQEYNIQLYQDTYSKLISFAEKHQNMFFCYGNHDISYAYKELETGYSAHARNSVLEGLEGLKNALPPENIGFIHKFDNAIFSHAGLTVYFVFEHFLEDASNIDNLIWKINQCGKEEMWSELSPLWARPQYKPLRLYPKDMMQVVGHTPVMEPTLKGNLLSVDTFSTLRGNPIGEQRFVWVDTVENKWEYADI